ncbi:MAG: alkaline phosphatase family protein [Bacteroidales bacterium]|nr:alkaline phosphatase family protein [Bacteroidales bacterium]
MLLYANDKSPAKQFSPIRRKLLLTLAASIMGAAGAAAHSGGTPTQPKLLVGIVVEDLRNEYINLLREHFASGGFNRLLRDGVVIANTDFGSPLDCAAATAVLYTGASPSVNGIPAAEVFDRSTLRGQSIFLDPQVMGNYTTDTYSPQALAVTTVTDEAMVAGGGVTYAYAIAPDPNRALIMASHAGNCGMWLNDNNESWATTTYYRDVPSSLNLRNRLNPLKNRIDTMLWQPMHQREEYVLMPDHLKLYPFKYSFRRQDPRKMLMFKNSPKVNEEVTNFALENMQQLGLGNHNGTDVLSLAYSVSPYEYSINTDNRYELLDAYYRLDRELERLFHSIDKTVGLDNTLIFLAGTPPPQEVPRDNTRWQLPYGEFSTRKAISLLNLYLIAIYGNGDWVQGYHNGQFFLNHKVIEDKKLRVEDIRSEAAHFLQQMAGVKKAYSLDDIIDGRNLGNAPLRANTSIQHAGDVLVEVMPGWQIIDDFASLKRPATDKVIRASATTAPVFILAPHVKAQKLVEPVDARSIAPTVTSLLRIRSPNAAELPALNLE